MYVLKCQLFIPILKDFSEQVKKEVKQLTLKYLQLIKLNSFFICKLSADTIVYLATSPKCEGITGEFWFDREITSKHLWPYCTDSTNEEKIKFWNECCRLTKWRDEK